MNTLNKSLNSGFHSAKPVRRMLGGGERNQLQFETSRGNNVPCVQHARPCEEEDFAQSSPKRRKISHQISSPGSARSADDILDQLDPSTVTFGPNHVSQGSSQAISNHSVSSQGSVLLKLRTPSLGGLPEHRHLEKMMRSRPASKKQQKLSDGSQNKQWDRGPSSSPPQLSLSKFKNTFGFDINEKGLTDNHARASRPSVRGTARTPHSVAEAATLSPPKLIQDRVIGKQSPFFAQSSLPQTVSNGTQGQRPVQTNVRDGHDELSDRLNDQFVPVNGDRRTSGVSLSSDIDELQLTGTTVGNNPDVNTPIFSKRPRNTDPIKDSTSVPATASPDEDKSGIALSNIKPEKFVAPKPKVQSNTGRVREKKAPWSVALAAISTSGSLTISDSMALVHDEKSGEYVVVKDGNFTSVKLQPQKLLRISYEECGGKVRFMSAKSGTEENLVDIEFRHEKDVSVLLNKIGFRTMEKVKKCPRYVRAHSRAYSCQTDQSGKQLHGKDFRKATIRLQDK